MEATADSLNCLHQEDFGVYDFIMSKAMGFLYSGSSSSTTLFCEILCIAWSNFTDFKNLHWAWWLLLSATTFSFGKSLGRTCEARWMVIPHTDPWYELAAKSISTLHRWATACKTALIARRPAIEALDIAYEVTFSSFIELTNPFGFLLQSFGSKFWRPFWIFCYFLLTNLFYWL